MADPQVIRRSGSATTAAQIDEGLRAHMNSVYGLMSVGMVVTAVIAWLTSQLATTTDPSQAVAQLPNDTLLTQFGATIYSSPLSWIIMFAPLIMIFAFGAVMRRSTANTARGLFLVFSAVMGLSISSIFIRYTGMSIASTFLTTAIAFAGLSIWGYTTKRDISGWGSFLIMGLIGLIVAMIVNLFLQSDAIAFAVSAIGILIFAGLTAYDTQNIKNTYLTMAHHGQTEWLAHSGISGALNLYLNFLNLFLFMLQFMGAQE
ncbi:MAG: Bax inhibitor-1/YccA family protein [Pseudomonadota bacterium]